MQSSPRMSGSRLIALAILAVTSGLAVTVGLAGCQERERKTEAPPVARGRQFFMERCAPCHPNGGNTINPKKTLHGGVLADHGITTPADIVQVMRNPGPGMVRFDQATIPDADARLIAKYILATFR